MKTITENELNEQIRDLKNTVERLVKVIEQVESERDCISEDLKDMEDALECADTIIEDQDLVIASLKK